MEENRYRNSNQYDEREFIVCEGESATSSYNGIGKIGIIGQGRPHCKFKEIVDTVNAHLLNKFMANVETIQKCNRNDMRILMNDYTKERLISYTNEIDSSIEDYLKWILVVDIRDNEIVLGIPSEQLSFDGDVLSEIKLDDEWMYDKDYVKPHHCGKYTKKRKYRNKNKKRRK